MCVKGTCLEYWRKELETQAQLGIGSGYNYNYNMSQTHMPVRAMLLLYILAKEYCVAELILGGY